MFCKFFAYLLYIALKTNSLSVNICGGFPCDIIVLSKTNVTSRKRVHRLVADDVCKTLRPLVFKSGEILTVKEVKEIYSLKVQKVAPIWVFFLKICNIIKLYVLKSYT